jgi:hypothetical protein
MLFTQGDLILTISDNKDRRKSICDFEDSKECDMKLKLCPTISINSSDSEDPENKCDSSTKK